MKRILVTIDPQNDFCNPSGSLFVKGADEDMKRLAKVIDKSKSFFDAITITLDSHQPIHIAHPKYWIDKNRNQPNPFTVITYQEVENGDWTPYHPGLRKHALEYTKALEQSGKYVLCIWPPHCLIGTTGHNVYTTLWDSINEWHLSRFKQVTYKTKGSNRDTEHYSAVQADVPDPNDLSTQPDYDFIRALEEFDQVYIAGEALSHCVANTFRDVATMFSSQDYVEKLVLIEDCTSNVTGFENLGQQFTSDMKQKGMKVINSNDI